MMTSGASELLLTSRDTRGVVTLTLNDPARFNALGADMLAALQQTLDALVGDDGVRVVVLAGAGKAFCAGHNLKDMAAHPDLAWYQQLFAQCSRMMLSLQKLDVPVIARVHGMATAGGCQLVAQCDLAVAADNATFATSGIHYGLFCATPSVPLVRNVPAKRAMEMLLTGDFIDARTALAQGLVNRVVAADALDAVRRPAQERQRQDRRHPRNLLRILQRRRRHQRQRRRKEIRQRLRRPQEPRQQRRQPIHQRRRRLEQRQGLAGRRPRRQAPTCRGRPVLGGQSLRRMDGRSHATSIRSSAIPPRRVKPRRPRVDKNSVS